MASLKLTFGVFLTVLFTCSECLRERRPYEPYQPYPYNGFGQPGAGVGAPCDYDDDCAVMHTFCQGQQSCSCKRGFVPSPNGDRCLATVGAKCNTKYDCSALGPAGDCRQMVCGCGDGYVPSPNGDVCLKEAQAMYQMCELPIQCEILGASCIENKCQCPPGQHQSNANKCIPDRALHGGCDSNDECYIGEEFKGSTVCKLGTCRCREHTVETPESTCTAGAEKMGAFFLLSFAASASLLMLNFIK